MTPYKATMVPCCVFLIMMASFISTAISKVSLKLPPNQCALQQPPCGLCGRSISVTLIARNNFINPKFEYQVTVTRQPQRPLIYVLEKAADINGVFNFSASYHGNLGFMVNTLNHVTADVSAKTYWSIKSVTNGLNSLQCGVSSYVPIGKEVILFNFTTWSTTP